MVDSGCDRPDLAQALARKDGLFRLCMLRARWRLLLYRWGAGRVEIACLMRLFESVCVELQGLVPKPGAPRV
jgi:hypothetical protein